MISLWLHLVFCLHMATAILATLASLTPAYAGTLVSPGQATLLVTMGAFVFLRIARPPLCGPLSIAGQWRAQHSKALAALTLLAGAWACSDMVSPSFERAARVSWQV